MNEVINYLIFNPVFGIWMCYFYMLTSIWFANEAVVSWIEKNKAYSISCAIASMMFCANWISIF